MLVIAKNLPLSVLVIAKNLPFSVLTISKNLPYSEPAISKNILSIGHIVKPRYGQHKEGKVLRYHQYRSITTYRVDSLARVSLYYKLSCTQ